MTGLGVCDDTARQPKRARRVSSAAIDANKPGGTKGTVSRKGDLVWRCTWRVAKRRGQTRRFAAASTKSHTIQDFSEQNCIVSDIMYKGRKQKKSRALRFTQSSTRIMDPTGAAKYRPATAIRNLSAHIKAFYM